MNLRETAWRMVASFVSKQSVRDWLIRRAKRTPYYDIKGPDDSVYMGRWWLFNPYGKDGDGNQTPARLSWLPSIRIHHIMRPDSDRHMHDHPWNARTIILKGWYSEERPAGQGNRSMHMRAAGYSGRLMFGQYHRIDEISPGGVWTLFITWSKRGTWGFDVDGTKVPWREYLDVSDLPPDRPQAAATAPRGRMLGANAGRSIPSAFDDYRIPIPPMSRDTVLFPVWLGGGEFAGSNSCSSSDSSSSSDSGSSCSSSD